MTPTLLFLIAAVFAGMGVLGLAVSAVHMRRRERAILSEDNSQTMRWDGETTSIGAHRVAMLCLSLAALFGIMGGLALLIWP